MAQNTKNIQEKDNQIKNRSETLFDAILAFEQRRFEMLTNIEESRLKLHHEYAEKRAKLLSENKEVFSWLLDSLSDLRKERMTFQKKGISEIAEALLDCKVPDDLVKEWLHLITKLYHDDITVAQKMVSVDFEDIDKEIFDNIKEGVKTRLGEELNRHLETVKSTFLNGQDINCINNQDDSIDHAEKSFVDLLDQQK